MKTCTTGLPALLLLLLCACQKEKLSPNTPLPADGFTKYVIAKGGHYCTGNALVPLETAELKFTVRFDSSAIYQTTDPHNQHDINKLYGFSDNGGQHHQFSARFGWRWSDGALRLFAYTYNNGNRDEKEMGLVVIGKEIFCSIRATGESYTFTLNNKVETLPRLSATPRAKGYRLYPYFGGSEPAPHEVRIWIKEE